MYDKRMDGAREKKTQVLSVRMTLDEIEQLRAMGEKLPKVHGKHSIASAIRRLMRGGRHERSCSCGAELRKTG